MIPSAVMLVRGDGFVDVCAWCAGKAEAEAWVAAQGMRASHGICTPCRPKVAGPDVIFEAGERCATPDSASAGRGTASGVPSRLVAFSCRRGGRAT